MCVNLLYNFGAFATNIEFLQRAGWLFWRFGSDWVKRMVEGNVSH